MTQVPGRYTNHQTHPHTPPRRDRDPSNMGTDKLPSLTPRQMSQLSQLMGLMGEGTGPGLPSAEQLYGMLRSMQQRPTDDISPSQGTRDSGANKAKRSLDSSFPSKPPKQNSQAPSTNAHPGHESNVVSHRDISIVSEEESVSRSSDFHRIREQGRFYSPLNHRESGLLRLRTRPDVVTLFHQVFEDRLWEIAVNFLPCLHSSLNDIHDKSKNTINELGGEECFYIQKKSENYHELSIPPGYLLTLPKNVASALGYLNFQGKIPAVFEAMSPGSVRMNSNGDIVLNVTTTPIRRGDKSIWGILSPNSFQTFYVYTDLVKSIVVGDVKANLLRMIVPRGSLIIKRDNGESIGDGKSTLINNALHSIIKQFTIKINNTLVTEQPDTQAYNSYIKRLLNFTDQAKTIVLNQSPLLQRQKLVILMNTATTNPGLKKKGTFTRGSAEVGMVGVTLCDLFNIDKLLLDGLEIKIRIDLNCDAFVIMGREDPINCRLKIVSSTLRVRTVRVSDSTKLNHVKIMSGPKALPAVYTLTRTPTHSRIIARGVMTT
ncbi:predicted protein [Nematostella vectensis]|uniref:Uncharacterized protein n=1 Tax=Nematostella vectensis TaxID=45351 RepID=A7SVF9_NEMVE|nr:predicted protein [Nematostella vectensis]|eukprot:XP_001624429.1 predicted protein [Nematostella vectensis]